MVFSIETFPYRRPKPPMVPLDSAVRTPGDSQKEGLFSERHRRPASASFDQCQAEAVAVEVNGAIHILNVDKYSDCRHSFPSQHYHGSPSISIGPDGHLLSASCKIIVSLG